jgi:hypothetical protein
VLRGTGWKGSGETRGQSAGGGTGQWGDRTVVGFPKVSLEDSWVNRAATAKVCRQGCQPLTTESSCLDK